MGFGPVTFGIAGDLVLIGAQAPLIAEVEFEQVESVDTRGHRYFDELQLLPSPVLPPRKYEWKGSWAYGARPELQLLSGQVDLAARVSMLFFKKTFRKKLASWNGIRHVFNFVGSPSGNTLNLLKGNPDFGIYGEDTPFVDAAMLRNLAAPSSPNVNTNQEPAWVLVCQAPPT